MDILQMITKQRQARRWSEYRLAEQSGLPQTTISAWYKKNMMPSLASMEKICAAFGMTMAEFFAGEDEKSVPLTEQQRTMLDKWSTLNERQKAALMQLMDTMNP